MACMRRWGWPDASAELGVNKLGASPGLLGYDEGPVLKVGGLLRGWGVLGYVGSTEEGLTHQSVEVDILGGERDIVDNNDRLAVDEELLRAVGLSWVVLLDADSYCVPLASLEAEGSALNRVAVVAVAEVPGAVAPVVDGTRLGTNIVVELALSVLTPHGTDREARVVLPASGAALGGLGADTSVDTWELASCLPVKAIGKPNGIGHDDFLGRLDIDTVGASLGVEHEATLSTDDASGVLVDVTVASVGRSGLLGELACLERKEGLVV